MNKISVVVSNVSLSRRGNIGLSVSHCICAMLLTNGQEKGFTMIKDKEVSSGTDSAEFDTIMQGFQ